jgi:two-component system, OmpR family, response regulator CpxR
LRAQDHTERVRTKLGVMRLTLTRGQTRTAVHLAALLPPARGKCQGRSMRPKKTILCVDDNEQVLAVRKFLLETRGGYRVEAASNGKDAIDRFRHGGVDLVLSDVVMPNMDGNELVRRMKEIAPEIPMILISGSVKTFDHTNRADAFLPKGSSSPIEMLERIRQMIARKRGPKKHLRPAFDSSDTAAFDPLEHAVAS